MTKILEIILILLLVMFSFFLGVKYSKNVKEYGVWIFEPNDSASELPELSSTKNINNKIQSNTNYEQNILDKTVNSDEGQNVIPLTDEKQI
jgi:hypothetical protein